MLSSSYKGISGTSIEDFFLLTDISCFGELRTFFVDLLLVWSGSSDNTSGTFNDELFLETGGPSLYK